MQILLFNEKILRIFFIPWFFIEFLKVKCTGSAAIRWASWVWASRTTRTKRWCHVRARSPLLIWTATRCWAFRLLTITVGIYRPKFAFFVFTVVVQKCEICGRNMVECSGKKILKQETEPSKSKCRKFCLIFLIKFTLCSI